MQLVIAEKPSVAQAVARVKRVYFQKGRDLSDYHRKFQYNKCCADKQSRMEY